MRFLRFDGDPFDRIHRTVHPFSESLVREARCKRVDWNADLRLGDERVGLFNASNLGWAVLESPELGWLGALSTTVDELVSRCPSALPGAAEDLLLALYARGLLLLDDQPYISDEVFRGGPLYHRTYLIELLLTERCNLRCTYCFAEVGQDKQLMSEDTAKAILDRVLALPARRMMIELSGGEVFLNFPIVRYIVEYLRAHGRDKEIAFSAQTNAALLNEEIVSFCADHQVHLSLTLDGPADIHDRQRKNWAGHGSHRHVIRAIELLQRMQVRFGVIGVVTANSVDRAFDIMNHYRELGIPSAKLNHCTPQGFSREDWGNIGIDGDRYLGFMQEVYRWMRENDAAVTEANIEVFFLNVISRTSQYRCTRTACRAGSEFLVFDPQGDVFPCPRFKNNPATKLGNVRTTLGRVDRLVRANKLIAGIDARNVHDIAECSRCEWRNACRGGCSLETYEAFHTLDRESGICSFYKGIYPFIFTKLVEDTQFIAERLVSGVRLVEIALDTESEAAQVGDAG